MSRILCHLNDHPQHILEKSGIYDVYTLILNIQDDEKPVAIKRFKNKDTGKKLKSNKSEANQNHELSEIYNKNAYNIMIALL